MPVVGGMGDPDILNGYTTIQSIQKPETIGYTDVEQRKKDVLACGVRNFMGGRLDHNVQYPGMDTKQVIERSRKIDRCIKSKGYIFIGQINCTKNGKPTGKCN